MHSGAKDFINKKAPLNYVAGLGRGATGFTTRSDIGPAREDSFQVDPLAIRSFGDDDDERHGDNEAGLLSNLAPYEADDIEADKIYSTVDEKLDERRKARREAREQAELQKYRKARPKIQQQFEDLKRGLKEVSEEEWFNIPEVGDNRAKRLKRAPSRPDRYMPVPDSVLQSQIISTGYVAQLDQDQMYGGATGSHDSNGLSTPILGTMTPADFTQINVARERQLGIKLDQASNTRSGTTSVDPLGYLTGLSSMPIKSTNEIIDIKRAIALLSSLVQTNPDNSSGWISLVRAEEEAGTLAKAKEHIAEACQKCPKSEDVWLEAARLNGNEAKSVLAKAVYHIPTSVNLWIKSALLESDVNDKKKIFRKALEHIPTSIKLWKATIELEEEEENARILLAHAVECVPFSVELWLALARLETYENARRVLNSARKACPSNHEIWIAAAKLEEINENFKAIDNLVQTGVSLLSGKDTSLSREQWIKEAQAAETSGNLKTCHAIIRATIGVGVEDQDRKTIWLEDAENAASQRFFETARAIYAHALSVFQSKKSIWRAAAFFERAHGSRKALFLLLEKAVRAVPHDEMLWLMAAKETWLDGNVNESRRILQEAFKENVNSEQIWLAAVKLENENGEINRARILLKKAREQADTPRVWMKSAMLERQAKDYAAALSLLIEAVRKFPTFAKLWMMIGQIYELEKDYDRARDAYAAGFKNCPYSIPIWKLAASLEEEQGSLNKARAILENARSKNLKSPEIWLLSVRLEMKHDNKAMAKFYLAKGLQECPGAGILWAEAIFMEPKPSQKSKAVDAWKKCPNDPHVALALARLFWADHQIDKARSWFERGLQIQPDLGDSWAYAYLFEKEFGSDDSVKKMIEKCTAVDPHHGELWTLVSKSLSNHGLSCEEILIKAAESIKQ